MTDKVPRAGPVLGPVAVALEAAHVRDVGVLAAVSGGVDSMVLLDVLVRLQSRLGLRLAVGHVHHGLRAGSADQDAALVKGVAGRYGVPCFIEHLNASARPRGASVETWARDARYAALEAQRRVAGAEWIVTAHSRNDQAETVLLNLLRGTGPRGLAGIPVRRGHILRPLLHVPRSAIAAYAGQHGMAFREDPSNRSTAYRRNQIRHLLIPVLARYNPRIVDALAEQAKEMREDDAVLEALAETIVDRAVRGKTGQAEVNVAALSGAAPALQRRVVVAAFRQASGGRQGLTRRHVARLLQLLQKPDGSTGLPEGLTAVREDDRLVIRSDPASTPRPRIPRQPVLLRPGVWTAFGPARIRLRPVTTPTIGRGGVREVFGPAILEAPLSIRAWQPGDRFQPLGVRGTKKLQDFFVDLKVPKAARAEVPLVCAGDTIAWVVGHRIAEPFRYRGERRACIAEYRVVDHV